MDRSRAKKQLGFSLVEIMMAIVLSSVVLIVGFSLLTASNQVNYRTESLLAANAAAFSKIQEYENKTFTNITIGDVASSYEIEDFSSSLPSITNNTLKSGVAKVYAQYANDTTESLIKLRVIIDFKYGNRDRRIEYGTYVQLGGVGR